MKTENKNVSERRLDGIGQWKVFFHKSVDDMNVNMNMQVIQCAYLSLKN